MKRKKAIIISALALVLAIVLGVFLIVKFWNGDDSETINNNGEITPLRDGADSVNIENNGGFVLLSNFFTDRTISDQESALAAISDVADIIGIGNVKEELSDCVENTAFGNTYYRFHQEYEEIPVYGRSIVVSADIDGNSMLLSGNYLKLTNLKTSPSVKEEEAIDIAYQNHESVVSVFSEGLFIYSLYDYDAELAWKIYVSADNGTEYSFISAANGKIIGSVSLDYSENIIGKGKDIDGSEKEFNTLLQDGMYMLQDEERGIEVLNANGGTIIVEGIIIDNAGKQYHLDEPSNKMVDSNGNVVEIDRRNPYGDWTVLDSNGNVIGEHAYAAFKLTTKNIITDVRSVTNKSNYWTDRKAVTVMTRVRDAYEFFADVLERTGFNNLKGEIFVVYNDFYGGDTTNAYAMSWGNIATLLGFGKDNSLAYDVVGHEYTHSVEHSISGMIYSGESGALMEAYSDIFGEIFEDWSNDRLLNGNCDWIHDNRRNMIAPSNTNKPDTYLGNYWADTFDDPDDEFDDHGGVHTNCTVISHAAYMMRKGIDGSQYYESLSTEQLARLFYSTLFVLPSDCDFSEFRSLMQVTAENMCEQGVLSDLQYKCVSNAFFQVGVYPAATPVARTVSLTIYGAGVNHEPYHDYTVRIQNKGDSSEQTFASTIVEAQGLTFPKTGEYEVTITDTKNTNNVTSIIVTVHDKGGTDNLIIFTKCGLAELRELILEEVADNSDYIGDWVIDNDKTITENNVSMSNLFGSAYSDYGCGMKIADNTFSYYIGAGIGGEGTWELMDDHIEYSIQTYEEDKRENGILKIDQNDFNELRVIMDYYGYSVYWKKDNAFDIRNYVGEYQEVPFSNNAGNGNWGLSIEQDGDAIIIWLLCWMDGISASVEDFSWEYQDGINQYTLVGNRSHSNYQISLAFSDGTVDVTVTCISDPYKVIREGPYHFSRATDIQNIPTDVVHYNKHSYAVFDLGMDWHEAKAYCEEIGGHLASITSAEEDAFLYSYITDAGYASVVFGLSDEIKTNEWVWVTGEPFSYQNWRAGEPNHQGGYEHYGMYYEKNKEGTWNDGDGGVCPFICEWDYAIVLKE